MAISIISAVFMLSIMAVFAILRLVIEIASKKCDSGTDKEDDNDSPENEEDSLLIDDAPIQEILQEVCDLENMGNVTMQDLQTVEETIVRMTVAKMKLAVHWGKIRRLS